MKSVIYTGGTHAEDRHRMRLRNGPRANEPFVIGYGPKIDRFGPLGIGIELHQPALVMKVKNVEAGSPAEFKNGLRALVTVDTYTN